MSRKHPFILKFEWNISSHYQLKGMQVNRYFPCGQIDFISCISITLKYGNDTALPFSLMYVGNYFLYLILRR